MKSMPASPRPPTSLLASSASITPPLNLGYHLAAPLFHEADFVVEVDIEPNFSHAHSFQLVYARAALLGGSGDRVARGEVVFEAALLHEARIGRLAGLLMLEVAVAFMATVEHIAEFRRHVLVLLRKARQMICFRREKHANSGERVFPALADIAAKSPPDIHILPAPAGRRRAGCHGTQRILDDFLADAVAVDDAFGITAGEFERLRPVRRDVNGYVRFAPGEAHFGAVSLDAFAAHERADRGQKFSQRRELHRLHADIDERAVARADSREDAAVRNLGHRDERARRHARMTRERVGHARPDLNAARGLESRRAGHVQLAIDRL